jgi:predicted CoA-binding protein
LKTLERTVKEETLTYLANGWKVLPVRAKSKEPLTDLVRHGFLDATSDPVEIVQWFRKYPEMNLGIAC